MSKPLPFDQSNALAINEARMACLRRILPEIKTTLALRTAVDVGCGVGYFSRFLANMGFEVTGLEYREANVLAARERHPDIRFGQFDVEADVAGEVPRYDLVLCTGLLYHLENPLRAVRTLRRLAGQVVVVESMLIPAKEPMAALVIEEEGVDQAANYLALIPSMSCLAVMLNRTGFTHVYRVARRPEHPEFHETRVYKQRRDILVASMIPLTTPELISLSPQSSAAPWTKPWGWRIEEIRWFLRKPMRAKVASLYRRASRHIGLA